MRMAAIVFVTIMLIACQGVSGSVKPDSWSEYRNRFISGDGRVIDNINDNISHSEGQGYAMLLAVAADDRKTFELLWRWTKTHLAIREDGLHAWKWLPEAGIDGYTPDKNNATDGDLLIAWALGRASRRFAEPSYGESAARIAQSLRVNLARRSDYGTLLLPGAAGFETKEGIVVNPSYIILPAYREMALWDAPDFWQRLVAENRGFLHRVMERFHGLAPDWVLVSGSEFEKPPHAELRFGYDALRIPLYICWQGDEKQVPMAGIARNWSHADAHSWIALQDNKNSGEPLTDAHHAVRWLLAQCLPQQNWVDRVLLPNSPHEYYAATLSLLANLAWSERSD